MTGQRSWRTGWAQLWSRGSVHAVSRAEKSIWSARTRSPQIVVLDRENRAALSSPTRARAFFKSEQHARKIVRAKTPPVFLCTICGFEFWGDAVLSGRSYVSARCPQVFVFPKFLQRSWRHVNEARPGEFDCDDFVYGGTDSHRNQSRYRLAGMEACNCEIRTRDVFWACRAGDVGARRNLLCGNCCDALESASGRSHALRARRFHTATWICGVPHRDADTERMAGALHRFESGLRRGSRGIRFCFVSWPKPANPERTGVPGYRAKNHRVHFDPEPRISGNRRDRGSRTGRLIELHQCSLFRNELVIHFDRFHHRHVQKRILLLDKIMFHGGAPRSSKNFFPVNRAVAEFR